jgi:hypothetical protein
MVWAQLVGIFSCTVINLCNAEALPLRVRDLVMFMMYIVRYLKQVI